MATLTHAESRRLYSWWWDSHISPRNSKWLQENLNDMDIKIKAMIKLIEEDADSFARRAEMYYKKRPELMKLVEEFYRAYRALAERYDHATGALHQARQTMEEAFPNQISFILSDEPPTGSSNTEAAPGTPDMPQSIRATFNSDNSCKDTFSMSSQYHDIKKNRAYAIETDGLTSKKGLLNEMFGSREEATNATSAEGRERKGLNFQDAEGNCSECKLLREEVSQLSKENESLKKLITSESVRADKAEAEVQSLKESISKLNSEKEATLLQHKLSLERISNLETEISCSQEDLKKLNNEKLMVAVKLNSAEERCCLLEKVNVSLQMALDVLIKIAKDQQDVLSKNQEKLEELNILLRDKHLRFMQAEMAPQPVEKLHFQSQEEVRLLSVEIQTGIEKLKEMELKRTGLEEELHQLKEKNGNLNEQRLSSALEIINLQDEIIFLKDSIVKLGDEVRLHREEKKLLHQELSCLKEDRHVLDQSYHQLIEQVEAVNSNVISLQATVKELQNGNAELTEISKKHVNERVVHLENLRHMKKITEKNVVLENSLSDANVEIESLNEKIKTLEESCEYLSGKISIHLSEKAMLVYQLEVVSQNMEKLSERNTLLENSLSDVNVELEGLRGKLEVLEESCQSLCAQKSTLISQVEGTIQNLVNLEARHAELEGKHWNLERENDLTLQQVMELQNSFKREKEEYETLILSIILSSKSQLSALENQIYFLQKESQLREKEFEVEEFKVMNAQIENFVLQKCLHDMNEKNSILSVESQKFVETAKCVDKLISELKQEVLVLEKKLTTSAEHNEKLREGIQLMLRELCIGKDCGSLDCIKDELLLQLTLHEIREFLKSFSDAQDENQRLLLEKSVNFTILEQFGLNVMDLTMDKNAIEQQSELKTEELLVLQNKELELLEMNERLRLDVQASNRRKEVLKAEMDFLSGQMIDLREAHNGFQIEISKLLEDNQSLSKELYYLREKKDTLEEENYVILVEATALENLCLIFRSSSAEKELELQKICNDLACLHGVTVDLNEEVKLLIEKLEAVEVENVCLKETVVDLYEFRGHFKILEDDLNTTTNSCKILNLEVESGKNLLAQKDIELLQANQKVVSVQDKNAELCKNLEGLQVYIDGIMVVKKDLENKIVGLSEDNVKRENEIACLHQANEMLKWELDKLHKEVEDLRSTEEQLTSELEKGADEVNSCELEIARLFKDIQMATVNAALFGEKILELLITCEALEISAMIQREKLHEEISLRNSIADELRKKTDIMEGENRGLKEQLNAYFIYVTALWEDITSMEEDIRSLDKPYFSNHQEKQDNQAVSHHHSMSRQEPSEDHSATLPEGILELQTLHAKVKALHKVLIDTMSLLEQEKQIVKVVMENSKEASTDCKLKTSDAENFTVKDEQIRKDIQLDLSSPQYGNDVGSDRIRRIENDGSNDHALDLSETTERGCNNQIQKVSPVTTVYDIECHQFEAVEEEKNICSSELMIEKELGIDKRELPNDAEEFHQEWNQRVIERLTSDAHRLSVLQTSVWELKRNMETSEMSNCPASFEYDTVRVQLKEAEGSILQLIDVNSELTKKARDFSASFVSLVSEKKEMQSKRRKKILELAQRGSEKIGTLELELQKIQYILLKLEEEHENKRDGANSSKEILLRDFLYGRLNSRRKKRCSCWCMRPKTIDD